MPNIIILIIASDNLKEYVEMQNIWRKYMNTHPNIKSFFIKNDPNIDSNILLNEELNTIFVRDIENYVPGIFNKTIESIRYCLNNFNFDYIYRTNLSSFLSLEKMYNFICHNHIDYGGVIGFHNEHKFASGCGFFMSKEVCEFLINYHIYDIDIYQYLDDVVIGIILTKKYNIDYINRIDIDSLDNPHLKHTAINEFHYRCNTSNHLHTTNIMNTLYFLFLKNNTDFISGEKIQSLCDVSFYSKEHLRQYPNLIEYCNKLIYVDSKIQIIEKEIIENSYSFFIKPDWINYFCEIIMPYINHPFILVTHNSDHTVGPVNYNYNHVHMNCNYEILNNKYLINWYGVNMLPNEKGINLPIGLENTCWKGYDYNTCLKNVNNKKQFLLYFNFNNTNPLRKKIRSQILANGFIENKQCQWEQYIHELSQYKFCISPPGNGIDCHRHWECIYVGTIPIILTNENDPIYNYFKNLPILFVEDYSIITPDFLEIQFEKFKNKSFDLDITKLKYWKNKFAKI
jgi:hypothetical protein